MTAPNHSHGGVHNPGTLANARIAPEKAARLMRLATYASVSVAVILICAKITAWLLTDSVSLLSTLIDSMLDALASLVNLFAVHHALQPADHEHRFGHGKAEPLSGLAQAGFIAGSAAFLLIEAGKRIVHPREIENVDAGLWVMGLSIILTFVLVIFQRYVVRQTGSVAIRADSLHYQTDIMVNVSVVASLLVVTEMGWKQADPIFAICIAAYIGWGAWQIVAHALDILMDRELPDEEREEIKNVALSIAGVRSIHDLKTRTSGTQKFIQMHVVMDPRITLLAAHEIAEGVISKLQDAYPDAEVLVHEDPDGHDEDVEFIE